ncbi:MAG: hypothetical protein HRT61_18125 [Ekhidna sp.]|nr:hypothetical protein [Ekhidna sp.]
MNFIRRSANSPNVYIYNLPENAGKIDAIKQGSLFLRDYSGSPTAGFLEVDLSTALKSIDEV